MPHYQSASIAFLTQHGKERVVIPVLDAALGCRVQHVTGFDTDCLGTFTRDIPRLGSQLDAARRKAQKGMELSGLRLGLASEGAFIPDPVTGMFVWNVELLVLLDVERDLEITGIAQQPGRSEHLLVSAWDMVEQFARRAGFPEHHLVVRPQHQDDPRIEKDVSSWDALEQAFRNAQRLSDNGQVFLETDLRAHANPTRMETIRQAASNLVARIQSVCPQCGTPGFWPVEQIPGLPCEDCGAPTWKAKATRWGCLKCATSDLQPVSEASCASPEFCSLCNP